MLKKYCIVTLSCVVFLLFLIFNFFPVKYVKLIKEKSSNNGLSSGLVASIIFSESRFNKKAKSNKGAVGLMQLMPKTAKSFYFGEETFKEEMLLEPKINIEIGCVYLKYLFDKYKDEVTVLACYNAGEKIVLEWMGDNASLEKTQIKYQETLNYVKKVQKMKKYYQLFMG